MELKICPFCGAKPNPPNFTLDQCGKYGALQCPECLALGPEVRAPYGTTEWQQIAADDWNRRAVPAPEQSDRERAERVWNEWSITEPLNRRNLYEFLASAFTQIRIEERERCAQVCEGMSQAFTPCADAIRGLK